MPLSTQAADGISPAHGLLRPATAPPDTKRGWRAVMRFRRYAAWIAPSLLGVVLLCTIASGQAFVSAELRADAARLFQELAAIRGLPPPGAPPPLVIQSREGRRRFVVAELTRKYSPT